MADVGKYVEFFKKIVTNTLESCIKQNIFIVEFRHRTGCLYDEDRKAISVEDEIKIIHDLVESVKKNAVYKCPVTGNMLKHEFEFICV